MLCNHKKQKNNKQQIKRFAVHATSMNNTNTLVSGDNKGYASYAMEKHFNGRYSEPGVFMNL